MPAIVRLEGSRRPEKKLTDIDRLETAISVGDVPTFVELLSSNQSIEKLKDRIHPWAADPKTVGALAATQLAILASTDQENDDDGPPAPHLMRKSIGRAGGIPPLVGFLKSDEEDRVHTGIVALNFLLAECTENAVLAHAEGAIPVMMTLLESPLVGMRAAASTCLRNLFLAREEFRTEFVALDGVQKMVDQLISDKDPALNHSDVQLEAMLNFQDLLEDLSGEMIEEYAVKAVACGALDKLKILQEDAEDDEVKAVAMEVASKLSAFAPP